MTADNRLSFTLLADSEHVFKGAIDKIKGVRDALPLSGVDSPDSTSRHVTVDPFTPEFLNNLIEAVAQKRASENTAKSLRDHKADVAEFLKTPQQEAARA